MKKFLFLSFLAFMILFQFNIDVFAYVPVEGDITVDDLPENEFDSVGHVVKGSFALLSSSSSSAVTVQLPYDNFEYLWIEHKNYPNATSGYKDQYWILGKRKNVSSPCLFKWLELPTSDLTSSTDYKVVIEEGLANDSPRAINGDFNSAQDIWVNGGWFVSNIPIFAVGDDASINAYKNNGDWSGAQNKNDVYTPPTVPAPTNIKMSSASKTDSSSKFTAPVVVSWDAGYNENFTWGEMRYRVQYIITYGYKLAGLEYSDNTGLVTIADRVKYKDFTTNYTISTDTLNTRITLALGDMVPASKWIKNIAVYITNIQLDDVSNTSQSRYVQYDYITKTTDTDSTTEEESSTEGGSDSENGSDGVGDGTQNGTQYNGNGVTVNVTQNNNGNGGTSSSGSGGSNFFDVIIALIEGLSNIVGGFIDAVGGAITGLLDAFTGIVDGTSEIGSFIHSGFGLLGENGFIAMIAGFMPFVPEEIWTIIITGVSVSITLLIASAVLRFLRG